MDKIKAKANSPQVKARVRRACLKKDVFFIVTPFFSVHLLYCTRTPRKGKGGMIMKEKERTRNEVFAREKIL